MGRGAGEKQTKPWAPWKAWELKVAIMLIEHGYSIYWPMTPKAPCDLIAIGHGRVLRIEVTKGQRTTTGRLIWPPHVATNYDVLAIYEETNVTFTPEIW